MSSKSFVTAGLTDTNAILDVFSGTHAVGIYDAPSGKATGMGVLQITRAGSRTTMSLKDASGGTLAAMSFDRVNPPPYSWLVVAPVAGSLRMRVYGNVWPDFEAVFGTDGYISGSVGNASDVFSFRNNMASFGSRVPDVFARIAGTWKEAQEAGTCLVAGVKPEVSVSITAAGRVSIAGKGSLTCKDTVITNQWDGRDDFIVPPSIPADGYRIYLDSRKSGGAQASGGIRIQVPALTDSSGISEVATTLAWVDGDISVSAPQKQ